MKWLILFLGIACNASASVLVKLAMSPPRVTPTLADLRTIAFNGPLLAGLALYGGAFVLYAAALARLPLNVAHPVLTSGAVAAVAAMSVLVFHEPFRWNTGVGIALVIAGVAFLSLRVPA